MRKGQKPSKHVRRVRTKKGRKSVVVNRKVKKRRIFGGGPLNYIRVSPEEARYRRLSKAGITSMSERGGDSFSEQMRRERESGERMVFEHQAKQKVFGAAQKAFGKSQVVFREKTKK